MIWTSVEHRKSHVRLVLSDPDGPDVDLLVPLLAADEFGRALYLGGTAHGLAAVTVDNEPATLSVNASEVTVRVGRVIFTFDTADGRVDLGERLLSRPFSYSVECPACSAVTVESSTVAPTSDIANDRARAHWTCGQCGYRVPIDELAESDDDVWRVKRRLAVVRVAAVGEWAEKVVTTDPPRYVPHIEWDLIVRLTASRPMRSVVFIRTDRETLWGLADAEPATEVALRVAFRPSSWADSDNVHVSFGWQHVVVADRRLKLEPRECAQLLLPQATTTGAIVPVATIPEHRIELQVLPLAEDDTERRRLGRWRVKPAAVEGLPEELGPLASGHQHGVLPPR